MTKTSELPQLDRISDRGLPPKAIILDCFGRGGSSIVWNMVGSSPDVLMPPLEWHQCVFGNQDFTRKAMRYIGRKINWGNVPFLPGFAARRTLRTIPDLEFSAKPRAASLVLKVMDYHLVFNSMIERGFSENTHIVLTRHPLPLCESLLRSGEQEENAIRQYNAVTTAMKKIAETRSAVIVRFEDLISSPAATCDTLYEKLGIAAPPDGHIRLKMKPFGAARTKDVDVASSNVIPVPKSELATHIAPDVNIKAVARLSNDQRSRLFRATHASAALFGYTADNY